MTFWFLLVFVRYFRGLFMANVLKKSDSRYDRLLARTHTCTHKTRNSSQTVIVIVVNTTDLMTTTGGLAVRERANRAKYFRCQKHWFYFCSTAIIVNEPKTKQMNRTNFLFGLFSIHAANKVFEVFGFAFSQTKVVANMRLMIFDSGIV